MSNRPPTAEEVLELYLAINIPANSHPNYDDWIKAKEKAADDFIRAVKQWENAKGPVTREWFEKRFGALYLKFGAVSITCWSSSIELEVCGESFDLYNPTRSKIEALVEMLGGKV